MDVTEAYFTEVANRVAASGDVAVAASDADLGAAVQIRTPRPCSGRTTGYASLAFSVSGASAIVTALVRNRSGALLGFRQQTVTAGTVRDAAGSGNYWAEAAPFDLMGGASWELRFTSLSSGTVSVRAWEV